MNSFSFSLQQDSLTGLIFVRVEDRSGNIYELKTSLRISVELWDADRQRPINIYLKKTKKINQKLDHIRMVVSAYLSNLSSSTNFSMRGLAIRIKKAISCDRVYVRESLFEYTSNYIKSREHLICRSTYKRYMVFFRLLQRFEATQTRHIMIEDVDAVFVQQFLQYGQLESYSMSTVKRTIYFVRTVLNYLERRGIRTFVYELELPREKERREVLSLSEKELVNIKKMEVLEPLRAARDWLVISCYTGQRVSDFMNFNRSMIQLVNGQECIAFRQRKTQRDLILPLHPAVQVVIANNKDEFPEKIPIQKYNNQIKEIVRLADCKELIRMRKRRAFRSETVVLPKWEGITSHIGRRSFATNFYGKIPTPLLMEATGHTSELMFNKYINPIDTERIQNLRRYFENVYKTNVKDRSEVP